MYNSLHFSKRPRWETCPVHIYIHGLSRTISQSTHMRPREKRVNMTAYDIGQNVMSGAWLKRAWAGDETGLYSWLSSSISIEQWFFRQVKLKVTFCEATKMSKKNQVVFVYFKPLNWSAWSGYVGDKNEHHGHEQDQKHRPHNRNHQPLLRVVHLIILVDKTNCLRFSIW